LKFPFITRFCAQIWTPYSHKVNSLLDSHFLHSLSNICAPYGTFFLLLPHFPFPHLPLFLFSNPTFPSLTSFSHIYSLNQSLFFFFKYILITQMSLSITSFFALIYHSYLSHLPFSSSLSYPPKLFSPFYSLHLHSEISFSPHSPP